MRRSAVFLRLYCFDVCWSQLLWYKLSLAFLRLFVTDPSPPFPFEVNWKSLIAYLAVASRLCDFMEFLLNRTRFKSPTYWRCTKKNITVNHHYSKWIFHTNQPAHLLSSTVRGARKICWMSHWYDSRIFRHPSFSLFVNFDFFPSSVRQNLFTAAYRLTNMFVVHAFTAHHGKKCSIFHKIDKSTTVE